jgi:hypothetical protein
VNGSDPDNNTNLDDNGSVLVGAEIRGQAITLALTTEPESSGNTNNSYDFGLLPDCGCTNSSGNLLTNASFENGTTGWTASGGSVTTGTGYVACGSKNGFNAASSGRLSEVYQDVTIAAGKTVTFSGYSGVHAGGLSCSPKLSLIFRNASGTVLSRTDVTVTQNVDANFGQLAFYTITATAPTGTAKVRVQSSTTCNTMKIDAFCLKLAGTGRSSNSADEEQYTEPGIPVSKVMPAEENDINGFDVTVSPNPVSTYFNVEAKSADRNTIVNVRVHNTDGKLVLVQKTAANSILKIDADKLASGMYFVEVTQGNQRKVIKLIRL